KEFLTDNDIGMPQLHPSAYQACSKSRERRSDRLSLNYSRSTRHRPTSPSLVFLKARRVSDRSLKIFFESQTVAMFFTDTVLRRAAPRSRNTFRLGIEKNEIAKSLNVLSLPVQWYRKESAPAWND